MGILGAGVDELGLGEAGCCEAVGIIGTSTAALCEGLRGHRAASGHGDQ